MEKFVFIFGPQAVGKMTVGQELSKLTGLKLFHNHMTIELLHPFLGFSPEMWKLTTMFRKEIFETMSKSDSYGLIFTKVWDLTSKEECEGIERMFQMFESQGSDVYLVELEADIEERLMRNKTPHRLEQKPTKRNIKESEENLLATMEHLRLNTLEGEIKRGNYLRVDNTNLSPIEVAQKIKSEFRL